MLVDRDLLEEVLSGCKWFEIKELLFNGCMGTLDIGVGVWGGRGQEAVDDPGLLDFGMEASFPLVLVMATIFDAVVGGQDSTAEVDEMLFQVGQQAPGGHGGVGGGELVGVRDKESTAFDITVGVLVFGEAEFLHLRPVGGDIEEGFHIGLEALEASVFSFDSPQVVFALTLFATAAR